MLMCFYFLLFTYRLNPPPPAHRPPTAPRALMPTDRWTTQHAMMVRLLQLKKAIQEYFRTHDGNARKVTTREWTIANEVCSLLDVVAEVTIKIQGGVDTHMSQTMFSMLEIKEIIGDTEHWIRAPDKPTTAATC